MSTEPGRPLEAETPAAAIRDSHGEASGDAPGVLAEIEAQPLESRAEAYQTLAGRLRTQLEQSDPSLRS